MLRLFVDIRFQVLLHSPPGGLFTFPSRYFPLSVVSSCLALDGGPPCFPPGSSCPVVLWIPAHSSLFRVRGSHSLCRTFPDTSTKVPNLLQVRNPKKPKSFGLGSSRFARRYSGNHCALLMNILAHLSVYFLLSCVISRRRSFRLRLRLLPC